MHTLKIWNWIVMWHVLRKRKKKNSLGKLKKQSSIENHCSVETYIKEKVMNLT